MIPSKIFSAVAFLVAVFSSSAAATSVSSREGGICYGCPQTIVDKKGGEFDLVDSGPSEGYLQCFYKNKKNSDESFCTYKVDDGCIYSDGDGFCPEKAIPSSCKI